ncbi:MAG: S46 family peptidase [Bacteroidales bacterium]|nr:S46 family peptidase [Bacteroidales bacterium]
MLVSNVANADEGMWLPNMINAVIGDMQAKGFHLNAEDVYSVNHSSLKDAVMIFGGGCTAEMISGKGLLITNHHCGYSYIQKHSSVEHDYLKDGFWAMNQSEEIPCPGLTVSFLERMDEVTDKVLAGYNPGMSEAERDSIVSANSKVLIDNAVKSGKGLKAQVAALFYGNQYFLYIFKVYKDVRFVAAPPSSIGKFGGDTDNWMWPRHTGDFSMFRIYADPNDNEPADYSEKNVPFQPKKFFEISTAGVKEGDFTFVYGCPGSTREYINSEAVKYNAEVSNPNKIALRTMRLETMKNYMAQDQKIRIQYSSKSASVSNAWKKWQGEAKGINKMKTVANKKAYEENFKKWAAGTEYEGVVEELTELQTKLNNYTFAQEIYNESIAAIEWPAWLLKGKRDSASFWKDYYQPIDEEVFVKLVKAYGEKVPQEFRPAYYDEKMAQYGTVEAWRDAIFASETEAAEFAEAFSAYNKENVAPVVSDLNKQINILMRTYMRGQMAFEKDKTFYPDANMTLRIAYGKVAGYRPADGIWYTPVSTLEGVMQKDNPEIFDYDIPQSLRDIYAAKDYGRWEVDGSVPVCFLATNHTSGGNSGSPVINADGQLIGINFDRVWEGTMSDVVFDPEICRNISLDIRYALFVIDKLGKASYLFDEMILK